jgi:hypothetical protein
VTNEEHERYIEQLQTIHMFRDELELNDADYRDLLYRLTGSRSAKYLTPQGRDKVISFMAIHKELDEAVARAEEARDRLNASYYTAPAETSIEKELYLDGEPVNRSWLSLEDILVMMRGLHGESVRLTGASEERRVDGVLVKLEFSS